MSDPDPRVIDFIDAAAKRSRGVLWIQLVMCIVLLGSWWPFSRQGWLSTRIQRTTDAAEWHPFPHETYVGLSPELRRRFALAKRFCEVHGFTKREQIVQFQNQQVGIFWDQAPLATIAPFGIQLAREDIPAAVSLALCLTSVALFRSLRRERANLAMAFAHAPPSGLGHLYRLLSMTQVISSPPTPPLRRGRSVLGPGIALESLLILAPALVFWTVYWFTYGAANEFVELEVVAPANTRWQAVGSAVLGAVLTAVAIASMVEAVRTRRTWIEVAAGLGAPLVATQVATPSPATGQPVLDSSEGR